MSSLLFSTLALSQNSWQLKKDQYGIKIWESTSPDLSFKTYKAETTISAELEKVKGLLMDLENIASFKEGISEISDVQWISEKEVLFSTIPGKFKRWVAPVEIGSYEIQTIVIPDTHEEMDPIYTEKYFSLWILVNAGNGKTYVKHIISTNSSEHNLDVDLPINTINQRLIAIENLRRLVKL